MKQSLVSFICVEVVESWDLPKENLEFNTSQIHFSVLSVQLQPRI